MDLTVTNPEPVLDNPLYWVLLNIKEGYTYNIPNITGNSDFYNPNQAVIDCGTTSAYLASEGAPQRIRIKTNQFRTLESGDSIVLIVSFMTLSE